MRLKSNECRNWKQTFFAIAVAKLQSNDKRFAFSNEKFSKSEELLIDTFIKEFKQVE